MKLHLTRITLATACLLGSNLALADEPTTSEKPVDTAPTVDTVHLRNGGLYRGHVTEIVPGDHVSVLVEGKTESKTIPWAEVDRVIVATTPVPPSGATPTHPIPPATPDIPIPMTGPTVRVHVSSPSTVILYRHPAGTTSWIKACTSPCDIELPLGDSYRVTGNNVSQSSDFSLHGSPGGTVNVEVSPQSTAGIVMGGLVGGAGVLTGYIGLIAALVGLTPDGDDSCCTSSDQKSLVKGGLIAMGIGALLTVGGVLIFVSSAKTDATVTESGGAHLPPTDAFKRDPMWRTASEQTSVPAAQFPVLFSQSF